jgi:hypothetical protein
MAILLTCSHCQNALQVREEHAGRRVMCPRCAAEIEVPSLLADATQGITEKKTVPAPPGVSKKPPVVLKLAEDEEPLDDREACPECGALIPIKARRCPECRAWLAEDEPPLPHQRRDFQPCPKCGSHDAQRVTWTPWGSFYGPALFTHVRCQQCGYGYNGRTGGSNLIPAFFFVTIPATLIVLILAALGYFLVTFNRQ